MELDLIKLLSHSSLLPINVGFGVSQYTNANVYETIVSAYIHAANDYFHEKPINTQIDFLCCS